MISDRVHAVAAGYSDRPIATTREQLSAVRADTKYVRGSNRGTSASRVAAGYGEEKSATTELDSFS
jgi:hypothetical protein